MRCRRCSVRTSGACPLVAELLPSRHGQHEGRRGKAAGTPAEPWTLKTPPGSSEYQAWRDESLDPPALVVQVGMTQLRYHLRAIDDLDAMLAERGDWVPLGSADEQKAAADGTVEAWARSEDSPVGGW
jgi:uncharacterized protein DUF6855